MLVKIFFFHYICAENCAASRIRKYNYDTGSNIMENTSLPIYILETNQKNLHVFVTINESARLNQSWIQKITEDTFQVLVCSSGVQR